MAECLAVQGEHNRANHRDQQDQAAAWKRKTRIFVQSSCPIASIFGTWSVIAAACHRRRSWPAATFPSSFLIRHPARKDQLAHQHNREQYAQRQIFHESQRAARQNRYRASSPQTGTTPRRRRHRQSTSSIAINSAPTSTIRPAAVEKGNDQPEHMHRIARENHHRGRGQLRCSKRDKRPMTWIMQNLLAKSQCHPRLDRGSMTMR